MSNFPKERSTFKSEIPIFEIPGGIHPAENKIQSNSTAIAELPLSDEFVLNLKGQAGNRSIPVVKVGDHVLKGQLIAQNDGLFSANHHAPTSGVISAIETRPIAHVSGLDDVCIVLSSDHADQAIEYSAVDDYRTLSREALLARILDAGIVGLGGASFPSHVKLQREHGVNTLIINAAECEPYITCDDRLLQDSALQVLQGAQIISRMYQNLKIIVGIEDNKPAAIEALHHARSEMQQLDDEFQLDIAVIPTKYPSGGEKQLIQLVTGEEVPKGKLPADLGIILHNVATCFAIYEAIILGQPLTSRIVTLTGNSCSKPANYRIPLGTPVAHLVAQLGQANAKPEKLIMGGPMMGFSINNAASGIVKATNCIIMASNNELRDEPDEMPCIRCGACMDACPASLLPQQLFWHAKSDEFDKAEEYNLFDCIECGACAYVCPSDIPLVQYYRYAKSTIRNNAVEKIKSEKARDRHEARLERIERVKREKAQKHKQAAEARKKAAAAAGKTDAKQAAVAAALARVQAKKAEKSNSQAENDTTKNGDS